MTLLHSAVCECVSELASYRLKLMNVNSCRREATVLLSLLHRDLRAATYLRKGENIDRKLGKVCELEVMVRN